LFPWRQLVPGVFMAVVLCGGGRAIGEKRLATLLAAKVDGLAVPLGAARGRFIDRHATNGVDCHVGLASFCGLLVRHGKDRQPKPP
jgi:hypothetical protein